MIKDISDRRKARRKNNSDLEISGTQEFFTPKHLCDEMLDMIPEEDWRDITKTFLDSTMGNGNFLVNIYERKLKYCETVNDAIKALKSIYGTELMADNTNECRNRLYLIFKEYCDKKNLTLKQFELAKRKCINILKKNIVCTDTFKWDYENWKPINEQKQLSLFEE